MHCCVKAACPAVSLPCSLSWSTGYKPSRTVTKSNTAPRSCLRTSGVPVQCISNGSNASQASWVETSPGVSDHCPDKPERSCTVCEGRGKVTCGTCGGIGKCRQGEVLLSVTDAHNWTVRVKPKHPFAGRTNATERRVLPQGVWPMWCKSCRGSGLWYCQR